jgi:hypothetical protein
MRFFVVTETNLVGRLRLMDNGRVKGVTPFVIQGRKRKGRW